MKKLTKEQMEIVKAEHPEWFNGIEVGKWYFKQYDRESSMIFFCQGHRNGNAYGYGIDTLNNGKTEWFSDDEVVELSNDGFREATPEEVKQALIDEAKKRYKEGDNIECVDGNVITLGGYGFISFNGWVYASGFNDAINEDDVYDALFREGAWASVITQEKLSLQDDIQALKDRWPDINFTVIAEGKK